MARHVTFRGLVALLAWLALASPVGAQPRGPGMRPTAGDPRTQPGATARTPGARVRTPPARRARVVREPPAPELVLAIVADDPRPYHVRVRLDVGTEPLVDALVDLRLLGFEVVPTAATGRAARPLRCAYPSVPTRLEPEKLVAGPIPGSVLVDDVVDLRMFCVGRAYEAIVRGASVRPVYGFRAANRTRYVARASRRGARPLAKVVGAAISWPGAPEPAAMPIRVGVPTADLRAGGSAALRPYVEGRAEGVRAYVRSDLFLFEITSPSGASSRCEVPRHPVVPILDFFARLTPGRRTEFTIDVGRLCPGLFQEPGIHDVVPIVELVYTGNNVGVAALTGRFRGTPSFVRVRPPADSLPTEWVRPAPGPTNGSTASVGL